jgi:hypothetical protein
VEPDWEPLDTLLHGWMFMGFSGDIRLYKNVTTRRYLNIDPRGQCYRYTGSCYEHICTSEALRHVLPVTQIIPMDWLEED